MHNVVVPFPTELDRGFNNEKIEINCFNCNGAVFFFCVKEE
jgi:hypothetical protein